MARSTCSWFALFLVCGVVPAWAQPPDGGQPTGVLTKPPALLKQVEARYPEQALAEQRTGTVEMEVDIGADGKVLEARVVKPAGHGFDEAALEAIRQFEFSAAEVDHVPAPVRITYAYEFFLKPEVAEAPVGEDVVNFSGVLLERGTRRPLANATVVVKSEPPMETLSDAQGRFSFTNVPLGVQTVLVTATDYARYEVAEEFKPGQRTEVTYYVRRQLYSAYETVVRAPRERKEVAQVTLKQEEIRLIPGTQGDALKVVQNLPGVSRSPFSLGVLIVRGGKPWDTRVYVDDTFVPQLFHFGGLYATFNSNLLEEISFQPGNFSAEYGRNIGGLVTARTRTPSQQGVHGYFDINLIDASALVEAPIGDGWSVSASGRRSYVDATLPFTLRTFYPRAEEVLSFTVAPIYYDYQLRVEHRPKGSRDRFAVALFGSDDYVSVALPNPALDPEGRGAFRTHLNYNRLSVSYEKQFSSNLRLNTTHAVGFDTFDSSVGSDLFFKAQVYPITARETLEWNIPELKLSLSSGLDLFYIPYQYDVQGPPRLKINQIPDPFISRQLIGERAFTQTFEPGVFTDLVWNPLEGVKLVVGARLDYDTLMQDLWLDPRVSAFYELTPHTTLKGAWGQFHQPPDYRQGLLSPTFGNPDLLPEGATHYAIGAEHRFTDALSLDVQLYYKNLFAQSQRTLASDSGASDQPGLSYTSTGKGYSMGAEILLRHQLTRNFFGWIAYSLSKSERLYRRTNTWEPHPLDQPHNLIAVGSYKLPNDFIVGARVRYASGALDTPYIGTIYDANGNYYYPLPGEPWSRRLPDFFQLDVRVDKRFVYDQWMFAMYLDVQNVTNYGNVEGLMNNFDFTQEQYLYGLPILPSLGIRGEF